MNASGVAVVLHSPHMAISAGLRVVADQIIELKIV